MKKREWSQISKFLRFEIKNTRKNNFNFNQKYRINFELHQGENKGDIGKKWRTLSNPEKERFELRAAEIKREIVITNELAIKR